MSNTVYIDYRPERSDNIYLQFLVIPPNFELFRAAWAFRSGRCTTIFGATSR
jgi:hypothetical protein